MQTPTPESILKKHLDPCYTTEEEMAEDITSPTYTRILSAMKEWGDVQCIILWIPRTWVVLEFLHCLTNTVFPTGNIAISPKNVGCDDTIALCEPDSLVEVLSACDVWSVD